MDWTLLTSGFLTRNKFWNESDSLPYRSVVATAVLIRDGGRNILADPSLPIDEMDALLRRRAGIGAGDIDIVYATHYHADHRVDADKYPGAVCLVSEGTLNDMREAAAGYDPQAPEDLSVFRTAEGRLPAGIGLVPLPGHTKGLTGLAFSCGGRRVMITGDAVMDEDFFRHGEGYWFDRAPDVSAATIRSAILTADIIIPGHGDWFRAADYSPFREEDIPVRCRRLTLARPGKAVYLIRAGGRRMVVDPFLPGPAMIRELFSHSGLYPVEIDAVIFTAAGSVSGSSAAVFRNAEVFFPGQALPAGLTSESLDALLRGCHEPELPWP